MLDPESSNVELLSGIWLLCREICRERVFRCSGVWIISRSPVVDFDKGGNMGSYLLSICLPSRDFLTSVASARRHCQAAEAQHSMLKNGTTGNTRPII